MSFLSSGKSRVEIIVITSAIDPDGQVFSMNENHLATGLYLQDVSVYTFSDVDILFLALAAQFISWCLQWYQATAASNQ